jgi:hypothetical protein
MHPEAALDAQIARYREMTTEHQGVSGFSTRAEEMVDSADCGVPAAAGRSADFCEGIGTGAVHLQLVPGTTAAIRPSYIVAS